MLPHLGVIHQGVAQVASPAASFEAGALDEVVRLKPPETAAERHHPRLSHNLSLGQLEIARHARLVDLQACEDVLKVCKGSRAQGTNLRQRLPLGKPVTEATFMLLYHGCEQGRYQRRNPDSSRQH